MTRRLGRRAWPAVFVGFALLASCGSSADPTNSTDASSAASGVADAELRLEIVDGELVGGARRASASLGDSVLIVVEGNTDDQVHVHGYDRYIDLTDGEGQLTFDALIPGVFEIELEQAGVTLVQLEVS